MLSTISTIINNPELSAGFIILFNYVVITFLFALLCNLTVNHAVKHNNRLKYYNRPITTQVKGNRQVHNRQRKVA